MKRPFSISQFLFAVKILYDKMSLIFFATQLTYTKKFDFKEIEPYYNNSVIKCYLQENFL